MASITYDGRSFMLDGRRVWLVSGSIHYARVPRAQWRDRVHAAKLAGLNTIEVPAVWSLHEPRAGSFDFKGERDIRHFIELIAEAGLRCILRTGPFLGGGYDFGGLPAWLTGPTPPKSDDMAYRTHNAPFLEATSRYITALAQQVRDMQVTAAGEGGPIILAQSETGWTCGDDELAQKYLGELGRFLREAGLSVPVINSNNLWTDVEGELDGWSGREHLLSMLRQLGAVRPTTPRMVIDLPTADLDVWGEPAAEGPTAGTLTRCLVEAMAAGGQFNLAPFAAGAHHAHTGGANAGGRLPKPGAAFVAQGGSSLAPLLEHGGPGPSFHALRRVTTFASQFGRVLAALDPDYRPVTLDPHPSPEAPKAARQHALSTVYATGSQGSVVFLIGPDPSEIGTAPKPLAATLLLPDGSHLEVNTHGQPALWCLFDVNLTARAKLDHCTFGALAQVGDVFVCFGAAGVEGQVSINGSAITLEPTRGKTPVIVEHEGVTVVVLSEAQTEHAWITEHGVDLNARGVRADGTPMSLGATKRVTRVSPKGEVKDVEAEPLARGASKPLLDDWTCAPADDYVSGASPRFAAIDGPEDLAALGAPYGYGWYRVRLKASAAKKLKLVAPYAG
ncbi:MAG: beta-galactosidase, partial [Planctomycetota bacterium]